MRLSMSNGLFLGSMALIATACGGGTAAVETTTPVVEVQATANPLIIGQSASNYGSATLDTGFLPDPHSVNVVSGAAGANSVDIANAGISPMNSGACRGFATAQPDYIVQVNNPGQFLRFFVNAPGDTTLVINDGQGNWWCSDDEGGNLNPLIEMNGPVAGQYDIWVGSYQAGANIPSVLGISELQGAM